MLYAHALYAQTDCVIVVTRYGDFFVYIIGLLFFMLFSFILYG